MTVKIAFFLPALDGAGAERVFTTLANGMVNRHFQVDFVLSSASGVFFSALDPKITVRDFGKKHIIDSFFSFGQYLRTEQPKVVISALSNANVAAIAGRILYSRSCKVIITQHINWPQVLANNPTLKERLTYQISKFLYPYATRIVAVSSEMADEIRRMPGVNPTKVLFIYNPVVTQGLLEQAISQVNHPWLMEKKEPVILGVGRLVEQKDFATLIRAHSKIQEKIKCKLIILGEGPERPKLEELISNLNLTGSVDLPGFSPNPYAFMTKADLFVLSSRFEGLPTVLIEAMACGTPVVSTNCISGPREILDGGKYGRLVRVEDPEALSVAILDSLENPIGSENLKARASIFSQENAIETYSRLVEQVLESNE